MLKKQRKNTDIYLLLVHAKC